MNQRRSYSVPWIWASLLAFSLHHVPLVLANDASDHEAAYLSALRLTSGGLAGFASLTGQVIPATGDLTPAQEGVLYTQMYDGNGNETVAYTQPALAAQNLVQGAAYLSALRQTSGSLPALQSLTGASLPTSGILTQAQIEFLFRQLYDSNGNQTSAYTQPTQAAQTLVQASAYLQILRQVSGALTALQSLTGQSLPPSGALTSAQTSFLFSQLIDANQHQTLAYTQPAQAAQSVLQAVAYLQALRQTSGSLPALQALTGQAFPTSGPLTTSQVSFLFTQLYNTNGQPTTAFTDPTVAAQAVNPAATYLQALRQTSGALAAFQTLNGQTFPAGGALTSAQIELLFTQLFDSNNVQTVAYIAPTQAAQSIVSAAAYVTALRQTTGALAALTSLTGQTLPTTGALTPDQIQFLFNQLYDTNKTQTVAYTQPTVAAQSLVTASTYLAALRQTSGSLAALTVLTGQTIPPSGILTEAQILFLFTQLYDTNQHPTTASSQPLLAAQALAPAAAYLQALRNTTGSLTALQALTGQALPMTGALTGLQIDFLFTQLYNSDKTQSTAFTQPGQAAQAVIQGDAYLEALRQTTGSLAALQSLTGQTFPTTGSLTPDQIQFLFKQLYDSDDQPTTAYHEPLQAAQAVVQGAAYLQALRQTPGSLDALQTLSGQTFPATGALSPDQLTFLFKQLFDDKQNPTDAYTNPAQAAQAEIQGAAYLQALRNTTGALDALDALTGEALPTGGALDEEQLQFLFEQLFDTNGHTTTAYSEPAVVAQSLLQANAYVQALRQTPGALTALQDLTGQLLPTQGVLSTTQLIFLFSQLFDASGKPTSATVQPVAAAQALIHADAFLQALRQTAGALAAFKDLTGVALPVSGPLTADQIQTLFGQLYDASGNTTEAYTNPLAFAKDIAALEKGTKWWSILGGLAAGIGVGLLLGKTGLLSTPWSMVAGGATAALIIGLIGVTTSPKSTPSASSASTAVTSKMLSVPVDPLATTSSVTISMHATVSTGSEGKRVSNLTVIDPSAKYLSTRAPDKAYLPLYASVDTQSPEAIAAHYAEGRWLAAANSTSLSAPRRQTALGYAGAADKDATVVTSDQ